MEPWHGSTIRPHFRAFFAWMLLGIERARAKSIQRTIGGWRLFGAALALSLLAGFPETAYISGLFVLCWAILRFAQTNMGHDWHSLGVLRLAGHRHRVAAPQLLAFFAYLPHAWLGSHGGDFAHVGLHPSAAIPSLVAPYALDQCMPTGGIARHRFDVGQHWGLHGFCYS